MLLKALPQTTSFLAGPSPYFGKAKPFKVGVYLGSFNPIHNGHLMLAERARDQENLDAVEIVALGNMLHKKVDTMEAETRQYLNELAVKYRPKLFASRWDIDTPSAPLAEFQQKYQNKAVTKFMLDRTLKLLDAVKDKYQKITQRPVELSYIVGIDGLAGYPKAWLEPEYREFVNKCRFLVAMRPGDLSIRKVAKALRAVQPTFQYKKLQVIPSPISSTDLRNLLKAGKDITRRLAPQAVADFLNTHRKKLFPKTAAA